MLKNFGHSRHGWKVVGYQMPLQPSTAVSHASDIINCSITNSTVTATDKTVGSLVGFFIMDGTAPVTVTGNKVENVTVTTTTELPTNASTNEVRTAEAAACSAFDTTTIGETQLRMELL